MFAKESMFHSPMFNSMKYIILFLLLAFSVYAENPRGVSVFFFKTTIPPPVEVKQEKEKETIKTIL